MDIDYSRTAQGPLHVARGWLLRQHDNNSFERLPQYTTHRSAEAKLGFVARLKASCTGIGDRLF
jgi:hypothetical protein